ncbi:hypothetical protein KR222_003277, partial [Zaprionus bogoriensis]
RRCVFCILNPCTSFIFPYRFYSAVCEEAHSVDGVCRGLFVSWSYDSERNECVSFIYGGCEGNNNRFETEDECKDKCVE